MSKLLSISGAAKVLGVSESTLRRWEREGQLLPDERRTKGGQRRFKDGSLRFFLIWVPVLTTIRKT